MSFEDGRCAALQAAKVAREKLVAKGLMKAHDPEKYAERVRRDNSKLGAKTRMTLGNDRKKQFVGKPTPQGKVSGVCWHKPQCSWQVRPIVDGKQIPVKRFYPQNATAKEIERSRKEAVEFLIAWKRER